MGASRVGEFGPLGFLVGLDRRLVFGEREPQADEGVHVAVGDVVDDLADGPAAFAIGRVELRVVEAADGRAQFRRRCGDFGDGLVAGAAGVMSAGISNLPMG